MLETCVLLAEGPRALVTPITATRMEVGFLKPTKASSIYTKDGNKRKVFIRNRLDKE